MKHVFPKFLSLLAPISLGIDGGQGGGSGDGTGGGSGGAAGGAAGAAASGGLPPPPDFRTYLNPDGAFAKHDWAGDEKDAAAKFKSLPDLWKSYRTLERINSSGNKVAVPTDASTPAEWDAFYEKMGRPASDDKYEVTVPDDLKGLTLDEAALKEFRSTAFKNGLNGKQAKAMTDYYFKSVGGALTNVEKQRTERLQAAEGDLVKDWGVKDGPKWKEQLALAEKGAALAGLTGDVLKATPELANNPHFIRAMAKVAMTVKEAPAAGGREGGGGFGGDPAAQIRAIMNDPKHPYHVKEHSEHKKAVADMAVLFAKQSGS